MIGKKVKVINEGSCFHNSTGTCVERHENQDAWWVMINDWGIDYPMMFKADELEELT